MLSRWFHWTARLKPLHESSGACHGEQVEGERDGGEGALSPRSLSTLSSWELATQPHTCARMAGKCNPFLVCLPPTSRNILTSGKCNYQANYLDSMVSIWEGLSRSRRRNQVKIWRRETKIEPWQFQSQKSHAALPLHLAPLPTWEFKLHSLPSSFPSWAHHCPLGTGVLFWVLALVLWFSKSRILLIKSLFLKLLFSRKHRLWEAFSHQDHIMWPYMTISLPLK